MNLKIFTILILIALPHTIFISPKELCAQKIRKELQTRNMLRACDYYDNGDIKNAILHFQDEIEDNPKNGYAYFAIAKIYLNNYEYLYDYENNQETNYKNCLLYINQAINYLPKNDRETIMYAHLYRAQCYQYLKDYKKAIIDYDKARSDESNKEITLLSYLGIASIHEETLNYKLSDICYQLIEDMIKREDLSQYYTETMYKIGLYLMRQLRYKDATEKFSMIIKDIQDTDSDFNYYIKAYIFRAYCYYYENEQSEAVDDIIQVLSTIKGNRYSEYAQYSDSLMIKMSNDEDNREVIIGKLNIEYKKDTDNANWPYHIGNIYKASKKHESAIKYYKEAYTIEQDNIFLEEISECLYYMGDYKNALHVIDMIISLNPEDSQYIKRAYFNYYAGNIDAMIKDISLCIDKYPDTDLLYMIRGLGYDIKEEYSLAISDYTTSTILNPNDSYSYLYIGQIYNAQKKWDEANKNFRKAILSDKEEKEFSSAYAYALLGYPSKAKEILDNVFDFENEEESYYNAACVYSILGEDSISINCLEKALETGFRSFYIIENNHYFDSIKNNHRFINLIDNYKKIAEVQSLRNTEYLGEYETITEEIPFVRKSGTIELNCSINGISLPFIFDTGASDVQISIAEAGIMLKNNMLSTSDIIGTESYQIANGEIVQVTKINLRTFDIGNLKLRNVEASVMNNYDAPLLLGMSVLKKLANIEIDNERNVLRIKYMKEK